MLPFTEPFVTSFTLSFPAEIYDKSQLMILLLLQLYSPSAVFSGATAGILLANIPVIILADLLAGGVPLAGALGINLLILGWFGLQGVWGRPPGNAIQTRIREFPDPQLSCMLACFLTEFGDKTQLIVTGLALEYRQSAPIIMGLAFATILTNYVVVSFKDMVTMNIFHIYRLGGYVFLGFALLSLLKLMAYLSGTL